MEHFANLLKTPGFTEAADLLEITLNEEKDADRKLTEVAVSAINVEASMQNQ